MSKLCQKFALKLFVSVFWIPKRVIRGRTKQKENETTLYFIIKLIECIFFFHYLYVLSGPYGCRCYPFQSFSKRRKHIKFSLLFITFCQYSLSLISFKIFMSKGKSLFEYWFLLENLSTCTLYIYFVEDSKVSTKE